MSIVKDARREGTVKYERHKPEQTLLYQIIEKYYPQFLSHMGQQDKYLPKYVRSEFEAYLKCGRVEYGFLRVRCEDCHHEQLVAFSWPLLRIHAPAAFVHPARHHAEVFSRGLPDQVAVRGEWQKVLPCWLMMCCPMSPLGNGY
jgi:ribosomal protein S27E